MKKITIILAILFVVSCIQRLGGAEVDVELPVEGSPAAGAGSSTGGPGHDDVDIKSSSHMQTASQDATSVQANQPEDASVTLQPSSVTVFDGATQNDEGVTVDRTLESNAADSGKQDIDSHHSGQNTESNLQESQVSQEKETDTVASPDSKSVPEEKPSESDVPEKDATESDVKVKDEQLTGDTTGSEGQATPVTSESPKSPDIEKPGGSDAEVTKGDLNVPSDGDSTGSKEDPETAGKPDHFQSYSEWRQKVLEEEEKSKQDNTAIPVIPQGVTLKPKLKINFSSQNCGAKVLTSNQEAENVQSVLTSNRDEYMLNPCSAQKKWFAIELCEPVQVKTVEIASLELFSSQPKSFRLFLSDRFPAKEWRELGEYQASQEKMPQAFQVDDQQFVKFVKVELLDHYGSEHFCPVTLFRVYGIPMADDEDDDNGEQPETTNAEEETVILQDGEEEGVKENSRNLFMSAKDTVMNLVKKVLYVEEEKDSKEEKGKEVLLDANYSLDGYPLPCVPETDDKFVKKRGEDHIPTVSLPDPDSQNPPTSKHIPIVTKLQDDEQIPSEHQKKKLVTFNLISSDQFCGDHVQNKTNHTKTSPHRMICSYVQTMMSNKIEQSCFLHHEATASSKSQDVPLTQSAVTTEDSSASSSQAAKDHDTPSMSISASTSSVVTQDTSTAARVSTSQSEIVPQEQQTTEDSSPLGKNEDASASQSMPDLQTKGTSSVLPEGEPILTKLDTGSASAQPDKEETLSHLEPSSTTPLQETSNSLTQTPVLDTPQYHTSDREISSTEKTSQSVKVSPSPASESGSSEEGMPTRSAAPGSEEERGGEKEQQKENIVKGEVVEQLVKADNRTVNKEKTINLVHVPLMPVAKRETAIMRLTNRIKALELNVSLSSRFLDELSHRFKKQSEDMMKLLNKTIAHFNNVTNRAEARDTVQQEQLDKLESRVENLTVLMSELSVGMEALSSKIIDRQMVWTAVEFVLLTIVCVVCLRRGSGQSLHPDIQHLLEMPKQPHRRRPIQRRNSVGVIGHMVPSTPIKKQASDSALATSSDSCHHYEIVEQKDMLLSQHPSQKDGSKKKKKKKHKNLESKSSVETAGNDDHESEALSATKLTKSAGLLFGTDAVTVLTGGTDTPPTTADKKSSPHKTSTKSLPTHSRQSSQTSIEIQKFASKTSIPPKKASLEQSGPTVIPPSSQYVSRHGSMDTSSGVGRSMRGSVGFSGARVQSDGVATLTNGAVLEKPGRPGHMWRPTDPHCPPILKTSKASTSQKGGQFKKSNGCE